MCPCSFFQFAKQGKFIKYPGNCQIHRDGFSPSSGWNPFSITGKLQYLLSAFSWKTCNFSTNFAVWSKHVTTSAEHILSGSRKINVCICSYCLLVGVQTNFLISWILLQSESHLRCHTWSAVPRARRSSNINPAAKTERSCWG